jgi:hypothetical protein
MIAFIRDNTLHVVPGSDTEAYALEQFSQNENTPRAGVLHYAFDWRHEPVSETGSAIVHERGSQS